MFLSFLGVARNDKSHSLVVDNRDNSGGSMVSRNNSGKCDGGGGACPVIAYSDSLGDGRSDALSWNDCGFRCGV